MTGTCSRCHRDEPARGQRYCRRCHRTNQGDERRRRRRELEALRILSAIVGRYIDGRASVGELAGAARTARELRPVGPWGVVR